MKKVIIIAVLSFVLINCKDLETQAKPQSIYTLKIVYLDGKTDTVKVSGIDYEVVSYNDGMFSVPQFNYLEVSGRKVAKNVRSVSLVKLETLNSSK